MLSVGVRRCLCVYVYVCVCVCVYVRAARRQFTQLAVVVVGGACECGIFEFNMCVLNMCACVCDLLECSFLGICVFVSFVSFVGVVVRRPSTNTVLISCFTVSRHLYACAAVGPKQMHVLSFLLCDVRMLCVACCTVCVWVC